MHTVQELGMILLLFVVTVLMFSSLEFAFEREGEVEAAVARQRDQVLYCTALHCTGHLTAQAVSGARGTECGEPRPGRAGGGWIFKQADLVYTL